MSRFLEKCFRASDISFYVSNISNIRSSPVKKKNYPQDQGDEMNTVLSSSLPFTRSIHWMCSLKLFFKVDRWVYGQNILKMPVKKFTFTKAAGCRPAILQKMNSFADIFQRLWH